MKARLARYWKAIFAAGSGLAAWIVTVPVADLPPNWAAGITAVAALLAVLRAPANAPKPPAEPQPPAAWPATPAE